MKHDFGHIYVTVLLAAVVAHNAIAVEGQEMQLLNPWKCCSGDDKWGIFSGPWDRMCTSVAVTHSRKGYAHISSVVPTNPKSI